MKNIKVISVRIVAGQLHQIIEENMKFIFHEITKNTPISGAVLDIKFLPVKLECLKCGWIGDSDNYFSICKSCGSQEVKIIQGNELYLDNIEVEDA